MVVGVAMAKDVLPDHAALLGLLVFIGLIGRPVSQPIPTILGVDGQRLWPVPVPTYTLTVQRIVRTPYPLVGNPTIAVSEK